MRKAGGSSPMFPYEMESACKINPPYFSLFSLVRNFTFVENSPILVNGKTTVSLVREILMLEVRGSSTLFSSEN
jgi:hypothetical protein